MNILSAAITYAEAHHDAFFLVIHLKGNKTIRGGVFARSTEQWVRMECPNDEGLVTTFVNVDSIEAIEIEP